MISNIESLINLIYGIFIGVITNLISDWIYKKISGRRVSKRNKIIIFVICVALVFIYLTWDNKGLVDVNAPTGLDKERYDLPAILNNKGFNLYRYNKYKEAKDCYDKAIEIDPSYEIAKNNRKEAEKL